MLSVLAEDIYNLLRERTPVPSHQNPRITYTELIGRLSTKHKITDGRDVRLSAALGDLVRFCQAKNWPLISALVVRADTERPGSGYYEVASPHEQDPHKREIEWAIELNKVRQHIYPINRSQS